MYTFLLSKEKNIKINNDLRINTNINVPSYLLFNTKIIDSSASQV